MRNGGRVSRPPTMAAQLGLAMCLAVLVCSFQPTVSEHKKKIIVKVPHLIKHIHHDVYKPVHVHKVHAKKVEHHHHEEHEDKRPKWKPKLKRGHHKARGSYSHLQPVLHHGPQEGVERQGPHRQGMEYDIGQEYGREHDYSQEVEGSLENYSEERLPHQGTHREIIPHERIPHEGIHHKRIPYAGIHHERIPDEGMHHERIPHERVPRERIPHEGMRNERIPHEKIRHEKIPHERIPHGHEGRDSREGRPKWEPIDLGDWFGGGKGKGSDEWLISSEDLRELKEEYGILGGKSGVSNGQKRKKDKPNKPKKPVVIDMEIEGWKPMMDFDGWKDVEELHNDEPQGYIRDPYDYSGREEYDASSGESFRDEEEYPDTIPRNKPIKNSKKNGKWSKPIEVREPSSEEDPKLRQRQNNHRYPLTPQASYQQVQPPSQSQPQTWNHQPSQKKWPEPPPTPKAHQWPHPQPTPKKVSPESQPSSVVWSGHHLQTPQHTMWHVQQHNVETTVHGAGSPNPPLPVHPPPLAPLQQASASAHRAAPAAPAALAAPAWPPAHHSPGVMQQWEQTVHMGDGQGPGSSYKVEVINYGKQ